MSWHYGYLRSIQVDSKTNDRILTESKNEGKNVPHSEGNRKARRVKAKVKRKIDKLNKKAYKILRGGVGNALIAIPQMPNVPQVVTSVP
jgi:hypothetical protein